MPPKDAVNEYHASLPRDADSVLRDAIDSMREAFALFGADDRLVFCNEAYVRLQPLGKEFIRPGVLFEDIIRTNVEKGYVADALGREEEHIQERMDLHRNPKGPIYRRFTNGSTFIINECRTPDGGTLLTSTEVTELKQIEEAIRESEQRLSDAVESILDGVALYDAADKLVFCNTAYRENLENLDDVLVPGTPFETIVRAAGERNLCKDDPDGLEKYVRRRMAEHNRRESTVHYYPETDSSVIVQEYRTSEGGTFIVRTDITELKRAEEALRSSDSRLRGAIDSLREGFAFYDADDRLVLFNDEYMRLHPNLDDVIKPGMYCEELVRAKVERGLSPEAQGREEDHIRERMEQHRNPQGTISRTLADGTSYIIKESRTPDGGTVVIETDTTERLKLESQARAEHDLMLDAIESIDGGAALFDADDVLVLCNSTYREKLKEIEHVMVPGVPYEEILRAYAEKGINTEAKADPEKYVRERLARHRNLEPSTVQMTKTGDWIMLREYRTSEGGTLIIRTDVTERKKAEEALRASETLLRTIMDNADVEITLKDLNGRFLLTNRKFQENHGLAQEQSAGKTLAELYSPKRAKPFETMVRKVIETGEPVSQELRPIGETAAKVYFTTKFPIRNDEGDMVSIGTVNIDITKLKEAEIALTESEARFRDIAEAASDHFWEMGPDFRFTFTSERFFKESRMTPEEVLGKTRMEFVGPETIKENPDLWKAHQDDLDNRRPFRNFEYSLKQADGQRHYFSVSGKPVFARDGVFLGYRGATTDITHYRQNERELSHHIKMDSLGHLAGGIAHNLNNLLQPILILGQMTRDSLEEGSREHQNLEVIYRAAIGARELVERISTFSRQKGFIRKSVDMFEVVREGLNLIYSTVPASITVREELDANTGMVFADPAQLQTVLMNLVANAVDAMKRTTGELTISLSRASVDDSPALSIPGLESGVYAKLAISDAGPGIDDETLNKIFDPFFTTKGIGMGTGLGLSTAFGIVHKHNGTIRVFSKPGDGTTFEVYLPLGQSDKA